ncbi:MAG: zinc-ribbon domain-containing protein [Lachnospiraceae bacterium]|nr:zinc-ribbon domain-containing protein [Lachnospiraceae bacterium]
MEQFSCSLQDKYPEIAAQWDHERNAPLEPDQVGFGSTKKVYWICPRGHSYQSRIDHRTVMRSGCPYCSNKKPIVGENDLLTLYPEIASEWDYDRNPGKPQDYLPKSNQPVYWRCRTCGFSFRKRIGSRVVNRESCPNCLKEKGTSFQEQSFLFYLTKATETHNRSREFGKEIDIFLPAMSTGIEYNGKYYHKKKRDSKDREKLEYLRQKGLRMIVIEEGDENRICGDRIELQTDYTYHISDKVLEWGIRALFGILDLPCPEVNVKRDHISIKEQYIISRKENNFAARYPEYAAEWSISKNGDLRPESFSCGSNHIAYFDCPVCKTTYARMISDRSSGVGCPVCAGKTVKKGYNDLATLYPEIASQWSSKNSLSSDAVTGGSNRKVWWDCGVCGFDWEASIHSRTNRGGGCPVCGGKKIIPGYNDLATLHPEIAAQWHPTKNGTVLPNRISPGNNKGFWWKCGVCSWEWKTPVVTRVSGANCPKCSRKKSRDSRLKTFVSQRGSLREHYPELTKQWDYGKNAPLTPDEVTAGSDQKPWWLCPVCGYSWQAAISARAKGGEGCPACGKKKCVVTFRKKRLTERGTLADHRPDLAAEWDLKANYPLTPQDVTVGSTKRIVWRCVKGHSWSAVVYSRKNSGCPYCAGKKRWEE